MYFQFNQILDSETNLGSPLWRIVKLFKNNIINNRRKLCTMKFVKTLLITK